MVIYEAMMIPTRGPSLMNEVFKVTVLFHKNELEL